MPIVPVRIKGMENGIITYAMLDSCSTGTFISEDLYNELGVQGTDTQVMIRTMNGPRLHDSTVVTGLLMSDLNDENTIELPKTFVKEEIPGNGLRVPRPESLRKWTHLQRVIDEVPPHMENIKVGLLVGTNCPKAIEPKDYIASQNGGPFTVLTFAGWTIVGPLHKSHDAYEVDCNRIAVQEVGVDKPSEHYFVIENSVKEIVTPKNLIKMFELEFNEQRNDERFHSQEDKRFLEKIESGTSYIDGHYQMPLPFRNVDVKMPSNKGQAVLRAKWLKKKLLKNEDFCQDYTKFMQDILEKNYARKIPPQSVQPEEGKVWYLPHHGVYHAKKLSKIRVVFDCSAKFE